jgi:hypothetical protein
MPGHSALKTRVSPLMSRASTSYFVSVTKDADGRDKAGQAGAMTWIQDTVLPAAPVTVMSPD